MSFSEVYSHIVLNVTELFKSIVDKIYLDLIKHSCLKKILTSVFLFL